jgi:hypothetical protein
MEGHPVQPRWPHEERPEGLCHRLLLRCPFVYKHCDHQISSICRKKYGKSSVTVRNLPNDFGKKRGWVPTHGAGV